MKDENIPIPSAKKDNRDLRDKRDIKDLVDRHPLSPLCPFCPFCHFRPFCPFYNHFFDLHYCVKRIVEKLSCGYSYPLIHSLTTTEVNPMSTPVFKLSLQEAAYNHAMIVVHDQDAKSKTPKETLFGVWKWGHTFIRLENTDKCFYRVIYNILAKIGLIKTEQNDPAYIAALKSASIQGAKPLSTAHLNDLDQRIQDVSEELRQAKEKEVAVKAAWDTEKGAITSRAVGLTKDLNAAKKELGEVKVLLAASETALGEEKTAHGKTEAARKELETANGTLTSQLSDTKTSLEKANEKVVATETENKALAASISSIKNNSNTALGDLTREKAELAQKLKEATATLAQKEEAFEKAAAELNTINAQKAEAERNHSTTKSELEEQLRQARENLRVVTEAKDQLLAQNKTLRSDLEQAYEAHRNQASHHHHHGDPKPDSPPQKDPTS